jgi:hypothetical protein
VSAKSRNKQRFGSAGDGGSSEGGSNHGDRTETQVVRERSREGRDADVAIVCGVSDDGQGVEIIRKRGERIETGTVRRLEQGKPIHGEVVRLRPREQFPMICDVEVEVAAPAHAQPTSSGPAQVATETYRKNWDAIYGRSRKSDPVLN